MTTTNSKPAARAGDRQKPTNRAHPSRSRQEELTRIVQSAGSTRVMRIKLFGRSPLLPHRFDQKARRVMLEKQMGKARSKTKEAKVPVVDAVNSLYFIGDKPEIPQEYLDADPDLVAEELPLPFLNGCRFGVKASSFKQSGVRAAKLLGHRMTDIRAALFVRSTTGSVELVEILTDSDPVMRCDLVAVQQTTDLRFRCELRDWRAAIEVEYNSKILTEEEVLAIFADAGKGVGVGDWRPEKNGQHGSFGVSGVELLGDAN